MNRSPTPPLAFPALAGAPIPQPHERRQFVETTPIVGRHGIRLTYYDADSWPRIMVELDESVPNIDLWRGMIQRSGDALPPLTTPRVPILGLRLVP